MTKTHPAYPVAFRAEAVELAYTSDRSIPQIARELGISDQAVGAWVKLSDIDAGRGRPSELMTGEREELRRLRRENQMLRQEREMLKKAAAFFANETS